MSNQLVYTRSDDDLILAREQYLLLWKISWISLFSCAFAIYRGYYDLACVPGGVWLTSINYWRRPDYSWRRYMDISYVHLSLIYQIIRAYHMQYAKPYYVIVTIGVVCFPISIYFHITKNQWLSTVMHCMVHIFGNISNFVLYSGFDSKISNEWYTPLNV